MINPVWQKASCSVWTQWGLLKLTVTDTHTHIHTHTGRTCSLLALSSSLLTSKRSSMSISTSGISSSWKTTTLLVSELLKLKQVKKTIKQTQTEMFNGKLHHLCLGHHSSLSFFISPLNPTRLLTPAQSPNTHFICLLGANVTWKCHWNMLYTARAGQFSSSVVGGCILHSTTSKVPCSSGSFHFTTRLVQKRQAGRIKLFLSSYQMLHLLNVPLWEFKAKKRTNADFSSPAAEQHLDHNKMDRKWVRCACWISGLTSIVNIHL